MKRSSLEATWLYVVLPMLFLTGCSPDTVKVNGEVFVVTEERENITLGLVKVNAFRTETLEDHLQRRRKLSHDSVRAEISACASLLDSLFQLGDKHQRLKAELDSRREKLSKVRRSLRVQARHSPSLEEYLNGNRTAASQLSTGERVVIAVDGADFSREPAGGRTYRTLSVGKRVTVVQKKGGYVKVRTSGEKGWVYHRNLSKLENYREYSSQYGSKVEALEKRNQSLERTIDGLRNDVSALRSEIDSIEQSIAEAVRKIGRFRAQGFYLSELPNPTESDKTGSDGQFELKLASDEPHFLVAEASRSVGTLGETYRWVVEITPGETREVILSNDNLGQLAERKYILGGSEISALKSISRSAMNRARQGKSAPWKKVLGGAASLNGAPADAESVLINTE